MNSPALDVRNLSVWLDTSPGTGREQVKVVDSVSFSIDTGQAQGLVGESGCGKTMMAMAIMGLLRADSTRIESDGVEINGRDISALNTRQRRAVLGRDIAMIFQQPGTALDPVFTIGQQLQAVFRRHMRSSRARARKTVLETLEMVGFKNPRETASVYPHQLSGGMRQLAMIAMAMVCKPTIILADEPTTALDASTRIMILEQLKTLQNAHNTAVLLISHDLSIVRQFCNRVMVMYCGRIVEKSEGLPLFATARHPYSAGLLACIPQIDGGRSGTIKAIPGQVPSLAELPAGCHFAPRCERAEARCRVSVPMLDAESASAAACFNPLS